MTTTDPTTATSKRSRAYDIVFSTVVSDTTSRSVNDLSSAIACALRSKMALNPETIGTAEHVAFTTMTGGAQNPEAIAAAVAAAVAPI